MVRGFVDMNLPAGEPGDGSGLRLQSGAAVRLDAVQGMRTGWRSLSDRSDLPTTQFELAVAAMHQLGPRLQAHVAYVTDGACLRAVLPLLIRPRMGVEQLEYMSPDIPMPVDIPHTDKHSLEELLRAVIKLGRPIRLYGQMEQSPVVDLLKEMSADRRAVVRIEPAEAVNYLNVSSFTLQDRIQSSARVSILATSYGLSGGPNDVIFQFVSPSLDQVMQLFHESLQLHTSSQSNEGKKKPAVRRKLDTFEFLRMHAFHTAQRGEIRFSCLRLAGRLLAVQMFQVRKKTAWLLTAASLERFRSTTLGTLLMGETIRKLQQEGIERLVVPSAASVREVGECKQIPCVNVSIYPWSSRSLVAMCVGRAADVSGRLLFRKKGDAIDGQTPTEPSQPG